MRNRRPKERRTNVTPAQKVSHSLGILAWNCLLLRWDRCNSQAPIWPQEKCYRAEQATSRQWKSSRNGSRWSNLKVEPFSPAAMVHCAISPATAPHPHPSAQRNTPKAHPQGTNSFPLTILTFSKTTGSIFFSGAGSLPLFHLSSFSFCNDLTKQDKEHWPHD